MPKHTLLNSSQKPYPILEYDTEREAFIEPGKMIRRRDVPEHCVICFFQEVIEKVVAEHQAQIAVDERWEDGSHKIFEIEHFGRRLAFFHPGIGGPLAAALLEEAIAYGCRKFITCGGCGVLEKGLGVGHLVVVSAALRDEGVSYHYLPAGREVAAHPQGVAALEAVLTRQNISYRLGKTWTIDAPYRETRDKIARRLGEGCITVEMEAASLMAVAQFRGVALGQILYGGDDLSGPEWDSRGWQSRQDVRENLFWLSAEACLEL
jgi:uridine phosphorylase